MDRSKQGYSLVEMLVVLAIIGILAGIFANSSAKRQVESARRAEAILALSSTSHAKAAVTNYFMGRKEFPQDNRQAGFTPNNRSSTEFTISTTIEIGAIQVQFSRLGENNQTANSQHLSYRPAFITDQPYYPSIQWVCGYAEVPNGYTAVGENKTTFDSKYLPRQCRGDTTTPKSS